MKRDLLATVFLGLAVLTCNAQLENKDARALAARFVQEGISVGEPSDERAFFTPPRAHIISLPNGSLNVYLHDNEMKDLAILKDMPISDLHIRGLIFQDFKELSRLPVRRLAMHCGGLVDSSPLVGLKLSKLHIAYTPVLDVSMIEGMPLEHFAFNPYAVTNDLASIKWPVTLRHVVVSRDATRGLSDTWLPSVFTLLMKMWWESDQQDASLLDKSDIESLPISLSLTAYRLGGLAKPWHFRIDENTGAILFHCTAESRTLIAEEKQVNMTPDDMQAVRGMLIRSGFFDLRSEYGSVVLDGACGRVISVKCGHIQKTVVLHCLEPNSRDRREDMDPAIEPLQQMWEYIESRIDLPSEHASYMRDLNHFGKVLRED